jgi:hypothetical protein
MILYSLNLLSGQYLCHGDHGEREPPGEQSETCSRMSIASMGKILSLLVMLLGLHQLL